MLKRYLGIMILAGSLLPGSATPNKFALVFGDFTENPEPIPYDEKEEHPEKQTIIKTLNEYVSDSALKVQGILNNLDTIAGIKASDSPTANAYASLLIGVIFDNMSTLAEQARHVSDLANTVFVSTHQKSFSPGVECSEQINAIKNNYRIAATVVLRGWPTGKPDAATWQKIQAMTIPELGYDQAVIDKMTAEKLPTLAQILFSASATITVNWIVPPSQTDPVPTGTLPKIDIDPQGNVDTVGYQIAEQLLTATNNFNAYLNTVNNFYTRTHSFFGFKYYSDTANSSYNTMVQLTNTMKTQSSTMTTCLTNIKNIIASASSPRQAYFDAQAQAQGYVNRVKVEQPKVDARLQAVQSFRTVLLYYRILSNLWTNPVHVAMYAATADSSGFLQRISPVYQVPGRKFVVVGPFPAGTVRIVVCFANDPTILHLKLSTTDPMFTNLCRNQVIPTHWVNYAFRFLAASNITPTLFNGTQWGQANTSIRSFEVPLTDSNQYPALAFSLFDEALKELNLHNIPVPVSLSAGRSTKSTACNTAESKANEALNNLKARNSVRSALVQKQTASWKFLINQLNIARDNIQRAHLLHNWIVNHPDCTPTIRNSENQVLQKAINANNTVNYVQGIIETCINTPNQCVLP